MNNQQNGKKKGSGNLGGLVLAVIMLIFFVWAWNFITSQGSRSSVPSYSTSSSGERYRNLSKSEAFSIAIEHVKEQLKSPSSAKYSYSLDDYNIINTGDTWVVSGYIEATNSFGAYIKSHFETKFVLYRKDGKDMVRYVYANID